MNIVNVVRQALRDPDFAEQLQQTCRDVVDSGGAGTAAWATFLEYFASSPEELAQMLNKRFEGGRVDSETYTELGPLKATIWTEAITSTIDCAASSTTTTTWVQGELVHDVFDFPR